VNYNEEAVGQGVQYCLCRTFTCAKVVDSILRFLSCTWYRGYGQQMFSILTYVMSLVHPHPWLSPTTRFLISGPHAVFRTCWCACLHVLVSHESMIQSFTMCVTRHAEISIYSLDWKRVINIYYIMDVPLIVMFCRRWASTASSASRT
jgi:hypothetical protein